MSPRLRPDRYASDQICPLSISDLAPANHNISPKSVRAKQNVNFCLLVKNKSVDDGIDDGLDDGLDNFLPNYQRVQSEDANIRKI